MSKEIIQPPQRSSPCREPESEDRFYEQVFGAPKGSFRGVCEGIAFFEYSDLDRAREFGSFPARAKYLISKTKIGQLVPHGR